MPIARQAPHPRLGLQQRQRILSDLYPAAALRRVVPAPHFTEVVLHLNVEVFDAVRGLEAVAQFHEQAQSVERQRLFESFLQRTGGSAVNLVQLRFQFHQPLFGPLIARLLIGALEPMAPAFLVRFRQVADDVLSFVPLAALHLKRCT